MGKYCVEKFENMGTGKEVKVYWECNKHVHNAAMITSVKIWLATQYPLEIGLWNVRATSYRSNQPEPDESKNTIKYG